MNFDYYFAVVVLTILLSIALIALVAGNSRMMKTKKAYFITSIVLLIFAASAEYHGVVLNGYPEEYRFLHIFLKVFELSVSPIMVICMIAGLNGFSRAKKLIPIAAVNLILQIISGFNGFMYYFDADNVYRHNTFYSLYTAVYVVCIIIYFTECIRFSMQYQNRNIGSLLAILVFLVLGLSIHIIFSDIRADWLTIAIAHSLSYSYYNVLAEQIDSLTRLLDRKSYDIYIASLNKKALIIMLDIDRFKSINDTYGHEEGDVYLKTVAEAIKNVYSRYGLCYRIGGDEFCVVMKREFDISRVNHAFNEDLKKRRGNLNTQPPEVSLGYAVLDPKTRSVRETLREADLMMYNKKRKRESGETGE